MGKGAGTTARRRIGEPSAATNGKCTGCSRPVRSLGEAMECESAEELMALAKSEGTELTKEADAYLAELADMELEEATLTKAAGGACYMVDVCPKNIA